ncbi:MAG TPA: acetyl-CoA synthetase [Candidatus Aenigmarchaeota archaeon]|nr:acetyl-CoA synthetase [Candidatus Aenigmarchaeota archaeon]HEX32950.1 acetyl-CoA synthetase [Candidatus Aenigmarchaeota archaeon]
MHPTDVKRLLKRYGIEYVPFKYVEHLSELKRLKFPVAMKVYSEKIQHKTDVGGVVLNINTMEQAKKVFKRLKRKGEGVIVQQMDSGIETIIGAKYDKTFGHVVMFGLGGVFTEVFNDVSVRVCPIDKVEAMNMIKEIKASKLFFGYRGMKVDVRLLASTIAKVSRMVEAEFIKELDFNPVFVDEKGARVCDFRVVV